MTREEEIMGMGERELYAEVHHFLYPWYSTSQEFLADMNPEWGGDEFLEAFLLLCYQAEERIKKDGNPGEWAKYGDTLWSLIKNYPYEGNIDGRDIATIRHIEPQIIARAILLTVEGNHE